MEKMMCLNNAPERRSFEQKTALCLFHTNKKTQCKDKVLTRTTLLTISLFMTLLLVIPMKNGGRPYKSQIRRWIAMPF
jgi:hypothetical protein